MTNIKYIRIICDGQIIIGKTLKHLPPQNGYFEIYDYLVSSLADIETFYLYGNDAVCINWSRTSFFMPLSLNERKKYEMDFKEFERGKPIITGKTVGTQAGDKPLMNKTPPAPNKVGTYDPTCAFDVKNVTKDILGGIFTPKR